jgi:flagellar biosynthesis/type III secretory pathway chaperone
LALPANSLNQAVRLLTVLDDEFEALKSQNLEQFERLQPEKLELLKAFASLDFSKSGASLASSSDWEEFQKTILECRDRHRRNGILIQRKLDAIRAALKTLQGADPASSVEIYDRLGRLAAGRRKGGYTEA